MVRLSYRLVSTLALAEVLALGSGLLGLEPAGALEAAIAAGRVTSAQTPQKSLPHAKISRLAPLPPSIVAAVSQDVSQRTGVSEDKVTITAASRMNYPNSCLGLARPGEICAEVIVSGFRIVAFPDISDAARVRPFIYRSDSSGRNLRREEFAATSVNLPQAVVEEVLQDASQRTGKTTSALKIVQGEKRTWPDECLGLKASAIVCTQALVEGWRVSVETLEGIQLIYRTNDSGSLVKLDEAASSLDDSAPAQPVQIPANELPPPLRPAELFRVVSSGGIAGRTTTTTLLADGRVIQLLATSQGTATSKALIKRVSPQQIRQFQRLL
ncbi:MAG TPA: hypothetical protein V6D03_03695, partial [Candidatus Caenarcaniphilales bacterium]